MIDMIKNISHEQISTVPILCHGPQKFCASRLPTDLPGDCAKGQSALIEDHIFLRFLHEVLSSRYLLKSCPLEKWIKNENNMMKNYERLATKFSCGYFIAQIFNYFNAQTFYRVYVCQKFILQTFFSPLLAEQES